MRANYASLAVFAGLASVATSDGLPPDAIPIQCATICGPMVELTALCDVHSRVRRRRAMEHEQNLGSREWVPKLAVEPKVGARAPPAVGQTPYRPIRDDDRLHRRNFTVIRPAPTSFAPVVVASLNLRPTTTLSHLNPIVVDRISHRRTTTSTELTVPTTFRQPSPPPSVVTPDPDVTDGDADLPEVPTVPTVPTVPAQPSVAPTDVLAPPVNPPVFSPPPQPSTNNNPATTTVTLGDASNTLSSPPMEATGGKEQKGTHNGTPATPMVDDMAEEQCVCLNTSFDVAQVAALCSSCIDSTGDPLNSKCASGTHEFSSTAKQVG